jgi:hypothetical protein
VDGAERSALPWLSVRTTSPSARGCAVKKSIVPGSPPA